MIHSKPDPYAEPTITLVFEVGITVNEHELPLIIGDDVDAFEAMMRFLGTENPDHFKLKAMTERKPS